MKASSIAYVAACVHAASVIAAVAADVASSHDNVTATQTATPTSAPTATPTAAAASPADTNPTINGDTNYWVYDAAISDEFDSAGSIDATKWTDELNGWIGTLSVYVCSN